MGDFTAAWRIPGLGLWWGALATSVRAVVVIGDDEADNLRRPLNGAPWAYVAEAQFRNAAGNYETKATAVYLGDRHVLTAGHVGLPDRLRLAGGDFLTDPAFGLVSVGLGDLGIFRLMLDPGLPTLPLVRTNEMDLSQASTAIGCGVGRGTTITGMGWLWGDTSSQVRRWGTNVTSMDIDAGNGSQSLLVTSFDLAAGADEAQVTFGDSGGGLFQKQDGTWKLAGLTVGVDAASALYDHDPNEPGLQPEHSYFERIRTYREEILRLTGLPDPGSSLESWRHLHFHQLAGIGVAADNADPDGDGVANLLEYAFGMNPQRADADSLPLGKLADGFLETRITEPDGSGGLVYSGETSSDLVHWVPLGDSGKGIEHRFRQPLAGADAGFLRIRVGLEGSVLPVK